ncbi:class I SAM-dependent methyltransferase [Rhodohalobacter sp. 614A]|uniref:class I SAM-dependent methyltransferase n=1 Tax=Rhodohalobacter sp. 614A TaxID=2908649 RepID=UPI001F462DD0|nr:class I SAM-dependent methyltransferase [Rhodohalobacter sp. 614A]
MGSPSTEIFARNWSIYQEVSKCNYMSHHDFFNEIRSFFQEKPVDDKPLDVLDCGCGDAWMLSKLLKGRNVNSFTGYDMSETALSYAQKNLKPLECYLSLLGGPMEKLIKKADKDFDLIYSSFAIHHLQDEEKKIFLADLYNHLKIGGTLIVIDIMRDDTLDRHEYLEEYIENIGMTWHTVTESDKELVYDHIRNFDFPAKTSEFISWLEERRFSITEKYEPDSRNVMITATKQ